MVREKKLLYFFGAGLGKACGFPTTMELNQQFKNVLNTKYASQKNVINEYERILQNYPRQYDIIDIEEIYTFLSNKKDLEYFIKKVGNDNDDITYLKLFYDFNEVELYESLKSDIEKHIEDTFWNQDICNFMQLTHLFPKDLLLSHRRNISLFTTNYDISVENYMESEIEEEIINRGIISNTSLFDSQRYTRVKKLIPYVKLHGSIDLYVDAKEAIRSTPGPIKNFGQKIRYGITPIRYYINYPYLGVPDKEYDEHQDRMFNFFEKKVKESTHIIILGTSLRDNRINEILNKNMVHKRVLLVGDVDGIRKALPKLKRPSNIQMAAPWHYPNEGDVRNSIVIFLNSFTE